uniref:NOL1/NOP2/Sun domain family member 4 n=2 Tax=Arion vulgaris TaxID=1028688 RepID=A0A0B7ABB8_9EUPU
MSMMRSCFLANILKKNGILSTLVFVPRRYRYKKKWSVNLREVPNCQQALNNFDAFYKPYFGEKWLSIRVSLLSLPKYTAVINKYGDTQKIASQLDDLDLSNFVDYARSIQNTETPEKMHMLSDNNNMVHQSLDVNNSLESNSPDVMRGINCDSSEQLSHVNTSNLLDAKSDNLYEDNLNVFVPTDQVYSERDQLLRDEISINSFQPRDAGFEIVPVESINISSDINAFVFSRGDVSLFPQPKPHDKVLGYYLMDAASVMPVIALDIHPTDQVLDLCAAPGGKSYIILQSLNLYSGGTLRCNDSSQSRLERLRSVLYSHFHADIASKVSITKMDGTEPCSPKYNKVLVDAPCNADRHAVTENDNSLFKMSRARERLGLMDTQKELLISGIKACVPGGTIVYSTCTLSPAQNDGVIQAALEELMFTTQIQVVVNDLSSITDLFGHVFTFHKQTRYGQLIVPSISNNFGPSYFAKLTRIK